jgi:hypothetical protein
MPSTSLSVLLREGFEASVRQQPDLPGHGDEPPLAGIALLGLARRMHDPEVSIREQDQILAAVIRCYRRHPASCWSAVLLEMLAPSLASILGRFDSFPPGSKRRTCASKW